jgi:hypothetical protein
MNATRKKARPRRAGQCYTYDGQADPWGGQYTLIKCVGPSRWITCNLPPSETEIQAIREDPWLLAHGGIEEAIAGRWERWGEPREMRFISRDEYARYF